MAKSLMIFMKFIGNLKYYLLFFLLIAVMPSLSAQGLQIAKDTVDNIIKATVNSEKAKLFVHYDKTVYLPNETIWFTAYLLNIDAPSNKADVLSVLLVRNNDRTISAQKKFVITGATSSGNMLIPDTIAAGDYWIIAYTNYFIKGKPDATFIQRISIKRIGQPNISGTLKQADTSHDAAKINIKFYPEGGDLVADVPCYVGWEAKDAAGAPLQLKAILLKDGEFADTVKTSTSGLGKFFIKPKYGSHYTVKVIDKYNNVFGLPAILDKGISLTVPSALVHDTLLLKIVSTLEGKVNLVIHNARKAFYVLANIDVKEGKLFKIALDSLPRGLAEITVFNDNMDPCAERVFFAHYDKAPPFKIISDQNVYGIRKKITLNLNFNSPLSKKALVSLACVHAKRIDRKHFNDIESFGSLTQSLSSLISHTANIQPVALRKYLDDGLLVYGWRKYSVDNAKQMLINTDTEVRFNGTVTINNRQVKKPFAMVLIKDSILRPIITDSSGHFMLPNQDLVTSREKPLFILPTGSNADNIQIRLPDPYQKINRNMVKLLNTDRIELSPRNPELIENSIFENQVMLNQVTIKSKKDVDDDEVTPYRTVANECGDYVCQYGVLNCPSHPQGRNTKLPIKGHRYAIYGGGVVTYQGCDIPKRHAFQFDGVHIAKQFYPFEDQDITSSEQLLNSTLYWNGQITLERQKTFSLSFYSGDIKGKFDIIVQGITESGTIYSEQPIEIK